MKLNDLLLAEAKKKGIDSHFPGLLDMAEGNFFTLEALSLMMYTESTMDPKHEGIFDGALVCGGLFAFHRDILSADGFSVRQVIDNGVDFQFNLKKTYLKKTGVMNCFWCTMADNYLPILKKEILNKNWSFHLKPVYFPFSTSGCTLFEYLIWLCFVPSITSAQLSLDYSSDSFRQNIYLFHNHSVLFSKKKMNGELNEALLHVIESLPSKIDALLSWKSMFTFVRNALKGCEYKKYSLTDVNPSILLLREDKKGDALKEAKNQFSFRGTKFSNTPKKVARSSKADHLTSKSRHKNERLTLNERKTAERILKEIKFKN